MQHAFHFGVPSLMFTISPSSLFSFRIKIMCSWDPDTGSIPNISSDDNVLNEFAINLEELSLKYTGIFSHWFWEYNFYNNSSSPKIWISQVRVIWWDTELHLCSWRTESWRAPCSFFAVDKKLLISHEFFCRFDQEAWQYRYFRNKYNRADCARARSNPGSSNEQPTSDPSSSPSLRSIFFTRVCCSQLFKLHYRVKAKYW